MDKETLTRVITKRLKDYMAKSSDQGIGLYEKYIPEFVDAALNYQFFKDNPDILPTIFIQETSAGRNITRPNNPINYGVSSPTISAQFAASDPITNLRNAIKEIAETGNVYKEFRTGKPMTDSELTKFAKKYEPANGNYPQYLKEGRKIFNEIASNVYSLTPTAMLTATPTPTQTQPTPTLAYNNQKQPVVDNLLFERNIREDSGSQVAYPTPVITSGEGSLGKRPRIEAEAKMSKSMQEAKEIQQMYNKKNFFQKLLTPKPVFSAENDTGEKGYIRGSYVTQNYGVKNPEYYGKDIHRGTDYHATKGTPVYGLAGWEILDTYKDYNLGNVLVMQNPNTGERIKFAHLDQTIGKRGDIIDNNDTIIAKTGSSGKTIKGKSQMEHLHVEYTDQNGRTSDITKSAVLATNQKAAEKGNPMVAMPKIVKPAMAAEKTSKEEPYYSQKGWEQSQSKTFEERARAGEYYGKSQGSYVIKPGDTLSALAKQYRTTVDDFVRSNPSITNPNVIRAGQSINVPSTVTDTNKSSGYVVRSGDNLTSIARNLGTTVNDLVRKNNIVNPNLIYTGTKLKI